MVGGQMERDGYSGRGRVRTCDPPLVRLGRTVRRGVPVVRILGRCEVLACVEVCWPGAVATALLHDANGPLSTSV